MKHSLPIKFLRKSFFILLLVGVTAHTVHSQSSQPWRVNGNGNTNSQNYLGTSDNTSLSLRTNGFERFLIRNNRSILMKACETCTSGSYDYLQIIDPNRINNNNNKVLEISGDQVTDNSSLRIWAHTGEASVEARKNGTGIGLVSNLFSNNPGFRLFGTKDRYLAFDQNFKALVPEVSASGDLGSTGRKWNHLFLDGRAQMNAFRMGPGAQQGYILTCVDANGNADWAPAPFGGWSANGNDIYNNNLQHVGIGTMNPGAKLHIRDQGAPGVTNSLRKSILRMEVENLSNTLDPPTIFDLEVDTKGEFRISEEINGIANPRMTIDEVGYIGIGSANPKARLHVNGFGYIERTESTTWAKTKATMGISAVSAGDQGLRFEISADNGNTMEDVLHLKNNATVGVGTTDIAHNTKMKIQSNKEKGLTINNVGVTVNNGVQPINLLAEVGTTQTNAIVVSNLNSVNCPGEYTFSVDGAGRVEATEVEVKSKWCDYVFEPDYDLMPISELKSFLLYNKHLPNIPPAIEVETEGLKLGNMQMRMMEKIEELILYTIQQQDEINALKEMNTELIGIIKSKK